MRRTTEKYVFAELPKATTHVKCLHLFSLPIPAYEIAVFELRTKRLVELTSVRIRLLSPRTGLVTPRPAATFAAHSGRESPTR